MFDQALADFEEKYPAHVAATSSAADVTDSVVQMQDNQPAPPKKGENLAEEEKGLGEQGDGPAEGGDGPAEDGEDFLAGGQGPGIADSKGATLTDDDPTDEMQDWEFVMRSSADDESEAASVKGNEAERGTEEVPQSQ